MFRPNKAAEAREALKMSPRAFAADPELKRYLLDDLECSLLTLDVMIYKEILCSQ